MGQLGDALLLLAGVLAFLLVVAGVVWTGVRLTPSAHDRSTKEKTNNQPKKSHSLRVSKPH